MTQFQVAYTAKGFVVYRTEFGIDRRYTGPFYPTPREACRYADTLAATMRLYASPLRDSGEAPTPVRVPLNEAGSLGVSPEWRERLRASRTARG